MTRGARPHFSYFTQRKTEMLGLLDKLQLRNHVRRILTVAIFIARSRWDDPPLFIKADTRSRHAYCFSDFSDLHMFTLDLKLRFKGYAASGISVKVS